MCPVSSVTYVSGRSFKASKITYGIVPLLGVVLASSYVLRIS